MTEIKRIDIREFWEAGYLQEVNRKFFHPLGLALEVILEPDNSVALGGIWDYRDDPEGIFFAFPTDPDKALRISEEAAQKRAVRLNRYGWGIQPVGVVPPLLPTDEDSDAV